MFGLGFLDFMKMGVGLALGVSIAIAPAYFMGKRAGHRDAATAALERSVIVLRQRNQINDEVTASDAVSLCGSFGLSVDEQAECVRRLGEASAEPGNVGHNPPN